MVNQVNNQQFGKTVGASGTGVETREKTDNLSRNIRIALSSVYIGHRNQGAAFIGEFPGEVLPGKTPILINPTKAFAPFELQAIAIEGDVNPLDKTLPEVENHPNSRLERNSAYSLARFYEKEFNDYGVAIPKDLIGAESEVIDKVFNTIFPGKAMAELMLVREIENVRFEGVFLDQLREYIRHQAKRTIREAQFTSQETKTTAEAVLAELSIACERGWSLANEKLNNTEKLIRQRQNGKPGKDWYETPDSRFPNAMPPLDLVCLAETGRVPLDLKPLDASREMSESIGQHLVQGIKEAFAPTAEETENIESFNMDAVKQLLEDQEKRHQEQMAELRKQIKPETEK